MHRIKRWDNGGGNPTGTVKGYTAPSQCLKGMSGENGLDKALEIVNNPNYQHLGKKAAARQMLIAAGLAKLLPNEEGKHVRAADVRAAYESYMDRVEGKPTQRIDLDATITDERPVVLDEARWLATTQPRELPNTQCAVDHDKLVVLSDDAGDVYEQVYGNEGGGGAHIDEDDDEAGGPLLPHNSPKDTCSNSHPLPNTTVDD